MDSVSTVLMDSAALVDKDSAALVDSASIMDKGIPMVSAAPVVRATIAGRGSITPVQTDNAILTPMDSAALVDSAAPTSSAVQALLDSAVLLAMRTSHAALLTSRSVARVRLIALKEMAGLVITRMSNW